MLRLLTAELVGQLLYLTTKIKGSWDYSRLGLGVCRDKGVTLEVTECTGAGFLFLSINHGDCETYRIDFILRKMLAVVKIY